MEYYKLTHKCVLWIIRWRVQKKSKLIIKLLTRKKTMRVFKCQDICNYLVKPFSIWLIFSVLILVPLQVIDSICYFFLLVISIFLFLISLSTYFFAFSFNCCTLASLSGTLWDDSGGTGDGVS